MKKILLLGGFLLASNLFALELCDSKFEIDQEFKGGTDWLKKSIPGDKDQKTYYEKIKGINTCQIYVNKDKKMEKFIKILSIKTPLTTPSKLENLTFKSGFNFYYKDKKAVEFETTKYEDFLNSLKEGINTLRVSKVNYEGSGSLVGSVNTMCSELGKNCTAIIEIKKPDIQTSEREKNNNNQLNFMLNKAIESQNLKLKSTEGWQ